MGHCQVNVKIPTVDFTTNPQHWLGIRICVQVEQQVYQQTAVLVRYHYKNLLLIVLV
jgi:hypothetical protein